MDLNIQKMTNHPPFPRVHLVLATENRELMHECCPQYFAWGQQQLKKIKTSNLNGFKI